MLSDMMPPPIQMLQMVMGAWVAQAVGAAARLSIADHLAAGAATATVVAEQAGANPDAVFRLMRALSGLGVFRMEGDRFSLTPLGETLRANVPGSMKHIVMAETDPCHWLSWGRFADAVKSGRAVARDALGMEPWDYYSQHPAEAEQFSRAMADISQFAVAPVLASYDPAGAEVIVDVGGAHGALLLAMLRRAPNSRGILFDLPHVTPGAKAAVEQAGLAARVDIVSGDVFKAVPEGGDLYLLKHILHDWDDAHCVSILKNVRRAMKPSAKLLIVEMRLEDAPMLSPAPLMDLNMLVMLSGRERTADQYGALVGQAGLTVRRFIPTSNAMGIVEAAAG